MLPGAGQDDEANKDELKESKTKEEVQGTRTKRQKATQEKAFVFNPGATVFVPQEAQKEQRAERSPEDVESAPPPHRQKQKRRERQKRGNTNNSRIRRRKSD